MGTILMLGPVGHQKLRTGPPSADFIVQLRVDSSVPRNTSGFFPRLRDLRFALMSAFFSHDDQVAAGESTSDLVPLPVYFGTGQSGVGAAGSYGRPGSFVHVQNNFSSCIRITANTQLGNHRSGYPLLVLPSWEEAEALAPNTRQCVGWAIDPSSNVEYLPTGILTMLFQRMRASDMPAFNSTASVTPEDLWTETNP